MKKQSVESLLIKPENIPPHLKLEGPVIHLENEPYDEKKLLFRDMGEGNPLITPRIAAELSEFYRKDAERADQDYMKRFNAWSRR